MAVGSFVGIKGFGDEAFEGDKVGLCDEISRAECVVADRWSKEIVGRFRAEYGRDKNSRDRDRKRAEQDNNGKAGKWPVFYVTIITSVTRFLYSIGYGEKLAVNF